MASSAPRLHILGASGSGTTTLGAALAQRLGCAHFDTDQYFWEPTDPPFTTKRAAADRVALMEADLDRADSWTLSGSLMEWGDVLIPRFSHVVFLYLPPHVRLTRLVERERLRHGVDIEPGGRMHEAHEAFVAWAKGYDDPHFSERSLVRHRAWLRSLRCPVIEIEDAPTVKESVARVLATIGEAPSAFSA